MANRRPLTIHAQHTREPISPCLYGQFIEHMGRCIHGGIWAEMLDDRKFFHSLHDDASPWQVIGNCVVDMATHDPFVGRHAAQVHLYGRPAGLVQPNLAVCEGRAYEGRVVLAGDATAGPIEIVLVWGGGPDGRQAVLIDDVPDDYTTFPLRFTARETTGEAGLVIAGSGTGSFRIGAVSIMPADNVHGMRADTLALLRELEAPLYRWPGGNFVSGYDWRDGLGGRDTRPPRKERAWDDVEMNDFGLDEFLTFCRLLDAEPYIVVNSGEGDLEMAAQQVEYANGAPDTPMGKRRAENGHTEPYRVRWWGVGNEMYGHWQLGHMPLEDYVAKHNAFVDAMRAVDSDLTIVAVGDCASGWSETMLTHCAGHMDLLSEHFYSRHDNDLTAHCRAVAEDVRRRAAAHRGYRQTMRGPAIPIAMDEWNYDRQGDDLYGLAGSRYYLKDALGVAAGLHQFIRDSDVIHMAAFAQTVNVIGAIKTSPTHACFSAIGLPLVLYRRHFGTVPAEVAGSMGPLDVAAAWTAEGDAVTVAVVNPLPESAPLDVAVTGAALAREGRRWTIGGADPMAYNEPGRPPQVEIVETASGPLADGLEVPPFSVCLYRFPARADAAPQP